MGSESKAFVRKLLTWFGRNARELPWRATRNPYAILVSEFMLQQTPVSRVTEYFPRFLARFPSFDALARARPRAVREAWDGLGYYARARNLHALAREVVDRYEATLPAEPAELRKLPGVGPYTAGAVACFAYERPVAAVDTNVKRVLGRAFGNAQRGMRNAELWRLASSLVPKTGKRAWKFNQAVMELGALICKARKPDCPACPVNGNCRTYATSKRFRIAETEAGTRRRASRRSPASAAAP